MSNIDYAQLITPEMRKENRHNQLLRLLSDLRWQRETDGVDVTETVRFQSDRTTRAELSALVSNFALGIIDKPVTWKALSGWEVLGPDQLRQVLWLINDHTQACFHAEKVVSDQIEQDQIADAAQLRSAYEKAYTATRNSIRR